MRLTIVGHRNKIGLRGARREDDCRVTTIMVRGHITELEFSDFAKQYAGLTVRESAAFYNKNIFCVRTGITQYHDEPLDDPT